MINNVITFEDVLFKAKCFVLKFFMFLYLFATFILLTVF